MKNLKELDVKNKKIFYLVFILKLNENVDDIVIFL